MQNVVPRLTAYGGPPSPEGKVLGACANFPNIVIYRRSLYAEKYNRV